MSRRPACIWVTSLDYTDTEGGHCQGACRPQWFFNVPLNVSQTALPITRSCEPREIYSLHCWRARNWSPQTGLSGSRTPGRLLCRRKIYALLRHFAVLRHFAYNYEFTCYFIFGSDPVSPVFQSFTHRRGKKMQILGDVHRFWFCTRITTGSSLHRGRRQRSSVLLYIHGRPWSGLLPF